MKQDLPLNLSRRRFVAGGGALIVSFAIGPVQSATPDAKPAAAEAPGKEATLPGSLKAQPMLDGWIRIDADGKVTVFTGKAELGQGIKTALLQVAAEELMVPPQRITMVTADTARTPNEKYTAGSHSMKDSGTAIRHASAQVRAILLGLAAQRLSVDAATLRISEGVIYAADARALPYGSLVAGQELHVSAEPTSFLRDPKDHTIVGKSMPRLDIPAKLTGAAAYVQDLRMAGMVHARIVRPSSPAAQLRSLDIQPASEMPGVLKIVRDGRFIGVIAKREYQAINAARVLAAGAVWDETAILPAQADLYRSVLASPAEDTVILDQGTPGAASGKTLSAKYSKPYQMHGSIGPSCAIAQEADGKYTVWTHSQGVFPLRDALAEMLAVDKEAVHCIHVEGSGCYGHNGADDAAADAILLARALPGAPVRVQWMREDEHGWEPLSPPMLTSVKATLDSAGKIAEWQYELWSNTHNARPGAAGNLLAATHLAKPFPTPAPRALPQPDGGGDRNAIPYYTLPVARVTHHFLPQTPLRVSALRGLGAYCNIYSIEGFMDELAQAAGTDQVAFRQSHVNDPRAVEVMRLSAEKFGWAGYQRKPRFGRGFAFARYKNYAAYAAIAVEVEVARDSGQVRIVRVVAAVDSGEAVNPDGIRNQIEGGIIQSCSWALSEEVTFNANRVTSRDWAGYPIMRFPNVPEAIDVVVVNRPGLPFLGTGEAAQGPAAAALANAIADATGVRFRDLPLSRARLRAGLLA
jgi:nicotinate dehydrogenase subunit B